MKPAHEQNQQWNDGYYFKDLVLLTDSFILRNLRRGTTDKNVRQMVASQISCRVCEIDRIELHEVDSDNGYPTNVVAVLQVRLKYGAIFIARALRRGKTVEGGPGATIYGANTRVVKPETIADYWNEHDKGKDNSLAG